MADRDIQEIAKRFAAMMQYPRDMPPDPDFGSLFAPKILKFQNTDPEPVEVDSVFFAGIADQRAVIGGLLPGYRQDVQRVIVGDDAFVITAKDSATLPDGTPHRVSLCTIVTVDNGLITRVDAYADDQQSAPLIAALTNLGSAVEIPENWFGHDED